jgi:hypothetical protein
MKKLLQKITLLIAVVVVTGHSIFPHIHHSNEPVATDHKHYHDPVSGNHHHDEKENNDDKQNGILSFSPLDDNFIPGKPFTKIIEPSPELLSILSELTFSVYPSLCNTSQYGRYREFPPPNDHLSKLPSRAPPHMLLS